MSMFVYNMRGKMICEELDAVLTREVKTFLSKRSVITGELPKTRRKPSRGVKTKRLKR